MMLHNIWLHTTTKHGHEDNVYPNDSNPNGVGAHIKRAQAFGYNSTFIAENAASLLPDADTAKKREYEIDTEMTMKKRLVVFNKRRNAVKDAVAGMSLV